MRDGGGSSGRTHCLVVQVDAPTANQTEIWSYVHAPLPHLFWTVHQCSMRWQSIVAHCMEYLTTFDDVVGPSTTTDSNTDAESGRSDITGVSVPQIWQVPPNG